MSFNIENHIDNGLDVYTNTVFNSDFNVSQSDANGQWVRVEEINEMLQKGVLSLDRTEMKKYHIETRVQTTKQVKLNDVKYKNHDEEYKEYTDYCNEYSYNISFDKYMDNKYGRGNWVTV